MENEECRKVTTPWYETLNQPSTTMSYHGLVKDQIRIGDVGIGLNVTGYDPELERLSWDGNGTTYFKVGLVSVSWGVLARVSVNGLFGILFAHVSTDRKAISIPLGNHWVDVRFSVYAHHNGDIRVFTSMDCEQTVIRFGRDVLLRGSDNFLD